MITYEDLSFFETDVAPVYYLGAQGEFLCTLCGVFYNGATPIHEEATLSFTCSVCGRIIWERNRSQLAS